MLSEASALGKIGSHIFCLKIQQFIQLHSATCATQTPNLTCLHSRQSRSSLSSRETEPYWQRNLLTGFSGGLELLFSDQRKHSLQVPAKDEKGNATTVGWLVHHLCEEVMKDSRKEMFVLDGHVYGSRLISPLLSGLLTSNDLAFTFQDLRLEPCSA